MTRFVDGPATGVTLLLKRAPVYLRAVHTDADGWDALDQLDDQAKSGEEIVVYKLEGEPTFMHIRRDRRAGGGGFFRGGEYRVVKPQPDDEDVRSNVKWRAWVSAQIGAPLNSDGTINEKALH